MRKSCPLRHYNEIMLICFALLMTHPLADEQTRKIISTFTTLLVGRPTIGLPVYFFANVRHVQWAIPQICSEGSVFIPLHFHFSSITLERILCDGRHTLKVWKKRVTVLGPLKPLTNAQTVRGRPPSKHENERAFRKGSFRELLANISNVAMKLLQVLK